MDDDEDGLLSQLRNTLNIEYQEGENNQDMKDTQPEKPEEQPTDSSKPEGTTHTGDTEAKKSEAEHKEKAEGENSKG